MEKFDIALSYVWEYDEEFIDHIERVFQKNNLSTYKINLSNIEETIEKVQSRKLAFNFLLDRAWDVEDIFGELGNLLSRKRTHIFNPYKNVLHAIDKATMHLEFITAGINVPYSIIIPPFSEKEKLFLSVDDLAILGRPFIIKPCNTTGGGIGVVTGAETLQEVIKARFVHGNDKYLLQEKILSKIINGNRAWFRVFWAFGKVIPVWWDDQTHIYNLLTKQQIEYYNLKKLFSITKKIFEITKLDFFSTEIVLTQKNLFVVIDYVNDMCDMRLKSLHFDGVPDQVVEKIIHNLKNEVVKIKRKLG